eukprot:3940147-Rhodomonas_salina.2
MHALEGANDNTGMVGWIVTLMNVYCIVAPIYNHFSKIFQGFKMAQNTVNEIIAGTQALKTVLSCIRPYLPCCLGAGTIAGAAATRAASPATTPGKTTNEGYSFRQTKPTPPVESAARNTRAPSTPQHAAYAPEEMGEGGPCEETPKVDHAKDTYNRRGGAGATAAVQVPPALTVEGTRRTPPGEESRPGSRAGLYFKAAAGRAKGRE